MKIGLVYSFQDSNWFSVTKIVGNLLKAYGEAFSEENLIRIDYSPRSTKRENEKSVKEGLSQKPQKLVFLDHLPHPRQALEYIGRDQLAALDEVIFHVFGDFTLSLAMWRASERFLRGVKTRFICASDKQVDLVRKFINDSGAVFKCPFPVDGKEFFFDPKARKKFRKDKGLSEEDFLFLYVGRISLQKNIAETLERFLTLKQEGKLSTNHKFWFAGEFDAIGNPYIENRHILGQYFRSIQKIMESFPEEVSRDVRFLGNVPNQELAVFYNGADRFFSLSAYHDEDYGMAVAEAGSCGLPCSLTDWAGYSSFRIKEPSEFTKFIPVKLGPRRAAFASIDCDRLFLESSKPLSANDRKECSKKFLQTFEVNGSARALKDIYEKSVGEFAGFSEVLRRLGASSHFKHTPFMNEMTKTFNEFYYEVYDVYAK